MSGTPQVLLADLLIVTPTSALARFYSAAPAYNPAAVGRLGMRAA